MPLYNWREIIFDLRRRGLTWRDLTRRLAGEVSEAAIRKYAESLSEPSHTRGELLLELWVAETGQPRSAAPRNTTLPRSSG